MLSFNISNRDAFAQHLKFTIVLLLLTPCSLLLKGQTCDSTAIYKVIKIHIKVLDQNCKQEHYLFVTKIQVADYKADTIYNIDDCPTMTLWEGKKVSSTKAIVIADDSIKDRKNPPYSLYYVSKPYFNKTKTGCRITTQVYTGHYLGYRTDYYYHKKKGVWYLVSSAREKKAY